MHPSRPERLGATRLRLKACAQFLYPTGRAIPPVAYRRLISNPGALAAGEKPNAIRKVPSIKHACGAAAFAA